MFALSLKMPCGKLSQEVKNYFVATVSVSTKKYCTLIE